MCFLPAERFVLGRSVPEVFSTALGLESRAVLTLLKTEDTVFLNMERPTPANNVFIFFATIFLGKQLFGVIRHVIYFLVQLRKGQHSTSML